ncbi:MAG: hypothetical protein WC866_05650 [Patescibacteria group bacterium]|jgi:hypothetical protein
MDQTSSLTEKTLPAKPLAGLFVVLFVVTIIGGWLYVDSIRNELEMKLSALEARLPASSPLEPSVPDASGGRVTEPTAINGWRTVISADGSYQLNLPPGTKLSESEGAGSLKIAYVVADPATEDNTLPLMGIQVAPASEKARYENQGGKLVIAGDKLYWLYLYENLEWEPYDVVVETFGIR